MTSTTIVDGLITSIGPYRVQQLIGRGGMGEVYRAFDTRRNRTVALKVLAPETADDESYRARFRRESDSAARLQDPHVIPIHDFGEIDGRLFIDMRLVDGVGLDVLLAGGALDPHRAVSIVTQVAEALTDAHAHDVVHRDVKPSNILVTRSGFVYLVDFGIARSTDGGDVSLTHTGAAVGTLAYMAPERFDGGAPDSRSDIYALACILAECLTGRRPFGGKSLPTLMKAHLLTEPPRPSLQRADVPRALDDVVVRGMAKDPTDRFQQAGDLAAAAAEALRTSAPPAVPVPGHRQPVQGTATVTPHPPPATAHFVGASLPGVGRRPVAVLAGATVLALVCGGAGFAVGRATAPAAAASASTTAGPTSVTPQPRVSLPDLGLPTGRGADTGTRPPSYTYTVESNYPVHLSYTDSSGDQVLQQSVNAPWSMKITTEAWGADARPSLQASSTSTRGDTTVSCTITDDQGRVVVADKKEAAYASTLCWTFG